MYEENKKSSQKTASQLPMTVTASEEVSQVKTKKTEKAVIHCKLSKEEVPRTSKRSGRSNPSPGQPVTGADDFFRCLMFRVIKSTELLRTRSAVLYKVVRWL